MVETHLSLGKRYHVIEFSVMLVLDQFVKFFEVVGQLVFFLDLQKHYLERVYEDIFELISEHLSRWKD